jgi:hypothetical protein
VRNNRFSRMGGGGGGESVLSETPNSQKEWAGIAEFIPPVRLMAASRMPNAFMTPDPILGRQAKKASEYILPLDAYKRSSQ